MIIFIFQSVAQVLNSSNLREQVFGGIWPLVTDVRIEEILDKEIVEQGFSLSYKPMIQNLAASRAHIRQLLTEAENNKTKEVAEAISKEFKIPANAISEAAISSYLANAYPGAEDALLNEIVSGISLLLFS